MALFVNHKAQCTYLLFKISPLVHLRENLAMSPKSRVCASTAVSSKALISQISSVSLRQMFEIGTSKHPFYCVRSILRKLSSLNRSSEPTSLHFSCVFSVFTSLGMAQPIYMGYPYIRVYTAYTVVLVGHFSIYNGVAAPKF